MDHKLAKIFIGAFAITSTVIAAPASRMLDNGVKAGVRYAETGIQYIGDSYATFLNNAGRPFYKNAKNPLVQEMNMFGRFQYQAARLRGDDAVKRDFIQNFDEYRRVRVGTKIKLLNRLELKANVNMAADKRPEGGKLKWGFSDFDEAKLTVSAGNFRDFKDIKFSYGRHKVGMGFEGRESSKKIKTVERSALSNSIFDNRYTGMLASATTGSVRSTIGFLSLDDAKGLAKWDEGQALYAGFVADTLGGEVGFDAFYNFNYGEASDRVGVGYEQAYSLSWAGEMAPGVEFMADVIVGDKGKDGTFGGLILQPSTYIVKDKIEFVAQYQFQQSSKDQGIETSSRYFSKVEAKQPMVDNNGGKGKSHHCLYGGFNIYLASHTSKIMTGIQVDKLDTRRGYVTGSSLWLAYRTYF